MSKNKVAINKGFVLGYSAIAILALVAGFISNYSSNLTVDADLLAPGSSCLSSSTVQKISSTSDEQEVFGENAVSFAVTTRQGNRLKVVLGAKEENRIGDGGIVTFTAGIQNLDDKKYSDKYGRIVLAYKDGNKNKKLDFYYNNPNLDLGAFWYKSISSSVSNYATVNQLELRNGTNYHFQACISKAIDLKEAFGIEDSTPTPTPTVTTSASATITATPTATATTTVTATTTSTVTATSTTTQTATPLFTIDIKHGYNAIYVQQAMGVQKFLNAGMVVFDYNYNGDKNWRQTSKGDNISELYPGTGYYIYYEGSDTSIVVTEDDLTSSGKIFSMKKGWNLLSSQTGGYLKDIKVRVLKTGYVSSCNRTDCTNEKTLKDLFLGDISSKQAYGKIYLVKDQSATDSTEAFEMVEVTEENIDQIELSDESIFWVYLFDL